MKKKVLSVLLATTMVATLLTGCGNTAATSDTAAAPAAEASNDAAAPAAEVTTEAGGNKLTVAAWDKNFNIPALEAAEADFKANVNPDFELEILEQGQSSDVENAITLAGSSGDYSSLPDIVLFQDHYIQRYVADYPDAWVSIDDAGVNWDNVGAEKASYSTINGVHYGFPVDNGTAIFAYRTDLLAEAGYTMDDVTGCTWKEFIEIGKAVYAKTGKYLLCMDGDGNDLFYLMMQAEGKSQWKDGAPYITENEDLVTIFNLLVEMAQNNVLYLANDWSDYTDQAITGDMVAGVCNGNWIIPTIKNVPENSGKWEITSMPTINGGEGYAANGGSSLYITSNCQNQALAKEFLAYTFGNGSTATYDDALRNGGVIGCVSTAAESSVYQEGVEYFNNQAIYTKIVEMGSHVPVIEQNDYHYSIRSLLAAALINCVNGADVETELQNAEDQIKFEMGL